MDLNPLIALKLLCNRMPRTIGELDQVMTDINGKILPTEHSRPFIEEMRMLASTYMRRGDTTDPLETPSPGDLPYIAGIIR